MSTTGPNDGKLPEPDKPSNGETDALLGIDYSVEIDGPYEWRPLTPEGRRIPRLPLGGNGDQARDFREGDEEMDVCVDIDGPYEWRTPSPKGLSRMRRPPAAPDNA